ncbi:Hypothetical Protein XM38_000040 [Halomicronema hongdechloris C2206]|uniref:Uncharacterized protein n=1 Tax=Halomicronema hongdechloris C2206 TaxID=1641165 RepID=A0A1Z3HFM8_9CYAN|nr:Uma2 family endonuclease [Halomicronema hongdechloris]ASC69078.1 Hypothetical Protein XM38_000040 [Halomicronema hongdechloris C2206]
MYQTDPPRPAQETLPTMYDLPSDNPEEPGLPDVGVSPSRDVFHDMQPQLLKETCRLPDELADNVFCGTDLNLYYDTHHPQWYKRPDWFLVLGVPRAKQQRDLRLSYVIRLWWLGSRAWKLCSLLWKVPSRVWRLCSPLWKLPSPP